jgi:hypothetical protein
MKKEPRQLPSWEGDGEVQISVSKEESGSKQQEAAKLQ